MATSDPSGDEVAGGGIVTGIAPTAGPPAWRRPIGQRIAWAAPLLVGASAAVAAEVATGILLYAGPGLMRSLTTVLAVEGAALAAGLWAAPRRGGAPLIDRLRRRWLFCLLAFMAAALFGTSWSVVQDLGGGPVGQGAGLALLAALPLYACGLVLGGMGAVAAAPEGGLPAPGAAAALGAASGFVLTGLLLPRAPIPASLLVACLVLLSAGGMIYGLALASRPVVHVRAARRAAGTEVRVEDHLRADEQAARYLLESEYVRRRASLEGEGEAPWEVAAVRGLLTDAHTPRQILLLGGGASALPRMIASERPLDRVDVLERNPAVLELAQAHFRDVTPVVGGPARLSVRTGNLEDLLAEAHGPYDLVLVDTAALGPLGGLDGLSRSARAALHAAVGSGGSLVAGPVPVEPASVGPHGWRTVELVRRGGEGMNEDVVVVSRPAGAEGWSGAISGFSPRNGQGRIP